MAYIKQMLKILPQKAGKLKPITKKYTIDNNNNSNNNSNNISNNNNNNVSNNPLEKIFIIIESSLNEENLKKTNLAWDPWF